MDDFAALLQQARQGSPEATEALLTRHAARLLATIRLRMGPGLRARLESRDLLQECLLKAFRSLGSFQGQDARGFTAWLARIAANEINDQVAFHGRQRRDARLEAPYSDSLQGRARSVSSRVAMSEQARRIESALEAMQPHYREVIVLRRLEELSFEQIGARLDRSADASRMLFARAMAALTAAIGEVS